MSIEKTVGLFVHFAITVTYSTPGPVTSLAIGFYLYVCLRLDLSLLWNSLSRVLVWLANWKTPGDFLSPPPQFWDCKHGTTITGFFYVGTGNQRQVLIPSLSNRLLARFTVTGMYSLPSADKASNQIGKEWVIHEAVMLEFISCLGKTVDAFPPPAAYIAPSVTENASTREQASCSAPGRFSYVLHLKCVVSSAT